MNWNQLRVSCCPKCSEKLVSRGMLETRFDCSSPICDFSIGEQRFNEIVSSMATKQPRPSYREEVRAGELNNLGRKVVSEDFSDSPFADRV